MTEHRTESEAEAGLVQVRMGGEWYSLPVLTIEQSEEWQAAMGAELANLDSGLPEDGDAAASMGAVLKQGSFAQRRVLVAYDYSEVLGGEGNIRSHMTQRELGEAVERILEAEFPFDEASRRSVVEMFGLPLRALQIVTEAVETEASRQAKSATSLFGDGASPTPTSDDAGRANSSSSAGRTRSGRSRKSTKRNS